MFHKFIYLKKRLLQLGLFIILMFFFTQGKCQEIKVDHVISVVSDIDVASVAYSNRGFTIRKGKQHTNGLINSHIKFNNNSYYELISIKGSPSDEIARNYKELLKKGEGGVFVAISGITTEEMIKTLLNLGIEYKFITTKAWNYITFPKNSSIEHFFFIDYKIMKRDSKEIISHENEAEAIKDIYVEGDTVLINFLKGIGIQYSDAIWDNEYGQINKFNTSTGNIIVVPQTTINKRPRIKSISFRNSLNEKILVLRF